MNQINPLGVQRSYILALGRVADHLNRATQITDECYRKPQRLPRVVG